MSDTLLTGFFDEGAYTSLFAGNDSPVCAAFGSVNGCPVYCVEQDGGAISHKDAVKILKALDLAEKTGNPLVTLYNSKGSVLSQGMTALTDAAALNKKIARISGVVPQIAVVTGVCGASAALAAAGADICIAVKGCELFLTSPFTAKAQGDKAAASSAQAAEMAGVAHIVADTAEEAMQAAAKLIAMLPSNNLSGASSFEYADAAATLNSAAYSAQSAIASIADGDSVIELMAGYGKNITTALATVAGNVCGFVATEGDKKPICAKCTGKAARFVRLCDAFGIPVVSLVNTEGFVRSNTDEIAGGLRAAARLAATYGDATTAKINVITGKAVGTAYTAFCDADYTIVTPDTLVAPLEPAAAVTVLYKEQLDAGSNLEKDTAALAAQYVQEQCGAQALIDAGLADAFADEQTLRDNVVAAMDLLSSKRVQRLPKKHGNMAL